MSRVNLSHDRRCDRRTILRASSAIGLASAFPFRTLAQADATPNPASDYANPGILIDAASPISMADDSSLRLIALMPEEDFTAQHIPGSVRFDWPDFDLVNTSDQAGIDDWRDQMTRLLTGRGISDTSQVVIYDNDTLFAARPWWVLDYLGHENARLLNGGISAWTQAGGEVASGLESNAAPSSGFEADVNSQALARLPDVVTALDDPDVVILDVRGTDEYVKGHIPGAVNLGYRSNAVDGSPAVWKTQAALVAMYKTVGVTPDKHIIPYCSTGTRSAVTYYTLRLIGFPRVSLFSGSWREWSSVPDLPVATGDQPG
jgi:thiosulfate/3-mercaptopyruvate sulfurtransferase